MPCTHGPRQTRSFPDQVCPGLPDRRTMAEHADHGHRPDPVPQRRWRHRAHTWLFIGFV